MAVVTAERDDDTSEAAAGLPAPATQVQTHHVTGKQATIASSAPQAIKYRRCAESEG
jgi:hypothetical protein